MPACSRTSARGEACLPAAPRALGLRGEALDSSQRRREAALDGDQLELVITRYVAAGVLDERGHPPQELSEGRPQRLDLAAFLHVEMMPEGRPADKPGSHRRDVRSGTV